MENDLVDRYARGELAGEDLKRFERSLDSVPERREKVANAFALREFIKEERTAAIESVKIEEASPTFWEKISAFFTLQYASAALMVLLIAGTSYLLYERYQLNQELANYRETQDTRVNELEKQEQILQDKLRETEEREQNLTKEINSKQGQTDILSEQLESEKAERQKLKNELERLRKERNDLPPIKQRKTQPPKPTIATILLTPFSGSRGGDSGGIRSVKINPNTSMITATLQIPKESIAESFTVRFGSTNLTQNIKPRKTKTGYKFITISLSTKQISADKDNVISVTDNEGNRYNFVFRLIK